eukprot:Hpha_TRINITY_DN15600_c0_g1::TRINITY_DN15600_c0_g1_i1::g.97770::m.97770
MMKEDVLTGSILSQVTCHRVTFPLCWFSRSASLVSYTSRRVHCFFARANGIGKRIGLGTATGHCIEATVLRQTESGQAFVLTSRWLEGEKTSRLVAEGPKKKETA